MLCFAVAASCTSCGACTNSKAHVMMIKLFVVLTNQQLTIRLELFLLLTYELSQLCGAKPLSVCNRPKRVIDKELTRALADVILHLTFFKALMEHI